VTGLVGGWWGTAEEVLEAGVEEVGGTCGSYDMPSDTCHALAEGLHGHPACGPGVPRALR